MERIDADGRWASNDGVAWRLVEPSEAFLQRRADAEAAEPLFPPLDPTGALATLLVVVGTLDLGDAANAIHEEPAHLEHEALAWEAASQP
jgi:hypothetical protein